MVPDDKHDKQIKLKEIIRVEHWNTCRCKVNNKSTLLTRFYLVLLFKILKSGIKNSDDCKNKIEHEWITSTDQIMKNTK